MPPRQPKKNTGLIWGIVAALVIVLAGGGVTAYLVTRDGGEEATATSKTVTTKTPLPGTGNTTQSTGTPVTPTHATMTTTTSAEAMGWRELANTVISTWSQAMQKLNTLLEGLPDAATIQPKVEALKEEYIQKLIELGGLRETLNDADQASFDSSESSQLLALGSDAWYATYMDNFDAYSDVPGTLEFCNLLASFNVLSMYANFTLLKTQLPEEATRLGIE
jgi:hypothetical protein